jgi:hypothetical protein
MKPGKKRRWLLRAIDAAAVVSVAYGFGDFVWVMAHPARYSPPAVPPSPIDLKMWGFNFPFFLFGLFWLIVRFSRAYAIPYQSLETKLPILKQAVPLGIGLGGAVVLCGAMAICSLL